MCPVCMCVLQAFGAEKCLSYKKFNLFVGHL